MIRLHIIAVALGLWGASLQCHSRVWGEWDTWGQQPDGKSVDFATGRLINEGNGREASKLIKKDGWYYLVFSEYKPEMGRYVMAKRTRSLSLPFAEEKMLALPSVDACEPNQGGIVEGPDGNWYFFTHHGTEAVRGPRLESPYLWLRSQWGTDGLSTYSYSTDGDNFVPFGEPYQLKWGNYRGDRLGLYCYNNQSSAGHADFDYLHYHMSHAR